MATLSQRSFSGGEISPALYARTDVVKYATGLRTLKNAFVLRHGGVATRPGTTFIGELEDSTDQARLIPFRSTADSNFVHCFTDKKMATIKNGLQVGNTLVEGFLSANGTTATATSVTVTDYGTYKQLLIFTTSSAHGYVPGDIVRLTGTSGVGRLNYEELIGQEFLVALVPTTTKFALTRLDATPVLIFKHLNIATPTAFTFTKIDWDATQPFADDELFDVKYALSADGMVMVHPDYAPRLFTDANLATPTYDLWAFSTLNFATSVSTPTGVTVSATAGTETYRYGVTAVSAANGEESLVGVSSSSTYTAPTAAALHSISWGAVSGSAYYNVYVDVGATGYYGLIGTATTNSFKNWGIEADYTQAPPTNISTGWSANNYPTAVGFFQQRLLLGAPLDGPEITWLSRVGIFDNLTSSQPLRDDDAFKFRFYGESTNEIKHYLDIGNLVMLTSDGEWTFDGDGSGIISPTAVNPKQNSQYGASDVKPIVTGGTAIFVQDRGSIIRDLNYSFDDSGYRGNDLTIFSSHLVDGYSIVDMAYQKTPHSIVWVVRSDGIVLSLTYVREQQVWGWARHDFGGTVESVCSVPGDGIDDVYFVVKRTIDGTDRRYVERLAYRDFANVDDYIGMDCARTFDGDIISDGATLTITGGTNWDATEDLTCTASLGVFHQDMIGQQLHVFHGDAQADKIKLNITGFNSANAVVCRVVSTVPSELRATATSNWTYAQNYMSGLYHLEGEQVSIFGDGKVISSPNNKSVASVTVANGIASFSTHCSKIHAGLPYISDIETLDIDLPSGGSVADKRMNISQVTVHLEDTRGLWVGPKPPTDDDTDPLEGLTELKIRDQENPNDPVSLKTGKVSVAIQPEWNNNGRVFIRQVDPVPARVLAILPAGNFPFRGGS